MAMYCGGGGGPPHAGCPGPGGGTPGGAGGQTAPPEDAHAAVTMQRIFNPPLDRNNDVEASVRHMNTQVDALLHHVSGLAGVPRLTLKPGTQTQWMVDHVGTRVQLTPNILLTVADVRRRDVWDVQSITLHLTSATRSTQEIVRHVEGLIERYRSFLTTQLTTAPCLFDQKDPPAAQAYNPHVLDPQAAKRLAVENAPKHLSFLKLGFYSNKTFDTLCGPEVTQVRRRVEFFLRNRDWYMRKGVPYQLGILMSGESGCGKTSSIRAIANMTGRHLVNLNFANIRTATQLKKLFQSDDLHVWEGDDLKDTAKLEVPISQRIYVLEEVDAVGAAVLERRRRPPPAPPRSAFPPPPPQAPQAAFPQGSASFQQQPTFQQPTFQQGLPGQVSMGQYQLPGQVSMGQYQHPCHGQYQPVGFGTLAEQPPAESLPDELTLGEILHVLDGSMETPGRIVIMTSNYPERLDSALVRPGRVDLTVRFGLASSATLAELYEKLLDRPFLHQEAGEGEQRLPDRLLSLADATEVIHRTVHEDLPPYQQQARVLEGMWDLARSRAAERALYEPPDWGLRPQEPPDCGLRPQEPVTTTDVIRPGDAEGDQDAAALAAL
jgi:hypothetical protein